MNFGKQKVIWCIVAFVFCGNFYKGFCQSSAITNIGSVLFIKDSLVSKIPRCPKVFDATFTYETPTLLRLHWDDFPAVPNQLEYEIRYKLTQHREAWKYITINAGNTSFLSRVKPGHQYTIEIRKLCYNDNPSFKLESEWSEFRSLDDRTSDDGICDSLGQIEILPDNNIGVSFTVPKRVWPLVPPLDCNLIFEVSYHALINGNGARRRMHWVYDRSGYMNFASDLTRLYPEFIWDSTSTPYLEYVKVSKYCVLDSNNISIFELGDVYGSSEWDSLNVEGECPDTIIFTVPETVNPNCGMEFEEPAMGSGTLASAQVGDTFTISGYPLLLTSVSGSNGVFSGEGRITLPWQSIKINVPFTSVNVNASKQITEGIIELASLPLFDPGEVGSFQIGGQICLAVDIPVHFDSTGNHSVTGLPWDERGFGADSTYNKVPPYEGYEEGDPYDPSYDPNGFGYDSIHVITGTIYNEQGCSQAGLDTLNQPCDPTGAGPYYWLNNNPMGPETAEGIVFANGIKDTLGILIEAALEAMKANLQDSISDQRNLCNGLRSTMDNLLFTLDYDRDFIYGENDEYYKEGMSQTFSSEPKPFQVSMERNPNTVILENKHIELYGCDRRLTIFIRLVELINELLDPDELEEFSTSLLEKIKRFTADQVTQYSNFNELKKWLEDEIHAELNKRYESEYGEIIGFQPPEKNQIWEMPTSGFYEDGLLASKEFLGSVYSKFQPAFETDENLVIIRSFRNGDLWINGTHRALLLEKMIAGRSNINSLLTPTIMPIEISKEISGNIYTIIIDRITLGTSGCTFDAFLVITDQKSGQKIVFQGLNIGFNPNGSIGESNLSLASEVEIRISNAAKLIIHGTPETYVAWDCSGFSGMGVDASVEFCREFLTPLDSNTYEVLPESDSTRVQAHFAINIPAWGDFEADMSIDPFAVTKAEHIKWIIDGAHLDFSDISSPDDIEFPEIYTSPFVSNGVASDQWKGFHLKQLTAILTNQMSDDTSTITFTVEDMIIDDRGFTGELLVATTLVSLEDGNIGGWPFSIDTLHIAIVANNLASGGISGLLNVPVFESASDPDPDVTYKDCFSYKAQFTSGGGALFVVSTDNNDLKAPLFKAGQIVLEKNSSIIMQTSDDGPEIFAHLNGSLNIQSSGGSIFGFDLDSIHFQGFEISNVSPYFSPGLWSLPGGIDINIGGFHASVDAIRLVKGDNEEEAAFTSDMAIEVAGDNLDVFASATTSIIGKLQVVDERQKWVFDRVKVDQILVDATIKGNRIRGGLLFYEEDPIFGKGFRGILKLDINALKAEVDALAQFGRHPSGYKYFLVDALASFDNGIGAGTFKIKGLGGGLYHRMSRDASASNPIPSFASPAPSLTELGESLSGIIYLPDSTRGIGFKATIVFVTGGVEKAFNGNATFEISFNSGGGIAEILLEGNARFMADIDFGQEPTYADNASSPPLPSSGVPLSAYVHIKFDFNNDILDGDLNVFLNTPAFQGKGPNGQMVWAKLYFSKKEWYVHIGTPSNPCGVVFLVPGVGSTGEVTAYLNIGTRMEPMPPLPPEVYELTGAIKPHARRSSGKGFAFGAAFKFSTPTLKFLIIEATLVVGAGFDVLIQDYGNAVCHHSGEKPGINGWYASGQVFAYLKGEVGVRALGAYIKVLELGVAAALQARLPNPVWLHGAFGVRYSVLSGLISGNVRFRFTIGQICELVDPDGTPQTLSVKVIESISPGKRYTEIPTNTDIYVALNYPINKAQFDEISQKTFSISCKESEILWRGQVIPALKSVQEDNMAITYKFYNMLPENDTIHFRITFDVKENGVVVESESDTVWFVTGERPDVIMKSNILYSYPLDGQYNFYRQENIERTGYIALDYGQPYLFQNPDKPDLLLIDHTGNTKELSYEYNFLYNYISFQLPPSIITPGYLYKLALVSLQDPLKDSDEFVSADINLPGINPAIAPPSNLDLPETQDLSLSNMNVICQMVFRASIYSTFHEKLSHASSNPTGNYNPNNLVLKLRLSTPEILSFHELRDLQGNDKLVRVYFEPPPGDWYLKNVYNRTYKFWPGEEGSIGREQIPNLNRSEEAGIPPFKSMRIPYSLPGKDIITEANFLSGSVETGSFPVMTTEAHAIMLKDWKYLQDQLKTYLANNNVGGQEYRNEINWLINNDFTKYAGEHKFRLEYFLPGSEWPSTSRVILFETE